MTSTIGQAIVMGLAIVGLMTLVLVGWLSIRVTGWWRNEDESEEEEEEPMSELKQRDCEASSWDDIDEAVAKTTPNAVLGILAEELRMLRLTMERQTELMEDDDDDDEEEEEEEEEDEA